MKFFELILVFQTVVQFSSAFELSIKIEENVPINSCSKVLTNLEALLTKTSEELHSVTNGIRKINHIGILLPDNWAKSSGCVQTRDVSALTNSKESDITVIENSDLKEPWASQYGRCGDKGRQVYMPVSQLLHSSSLSDHFVNVTLRQIANYRFGIFAENKELLCNQTECYDSEAPTKQNLLCHGQSPVEVLTSCYGNETTACLPAGFSPPLFTYSSSPRSLVVLVIDRMISDDANSVMTWETFQNAFFIFISKLTPGSALSIVTFGTEATLSLSPTLVTKTNAAELFAKIPRRELNQKYAESCPKCGIDMALKITTTSSSRLKPHIILASKLPFYPREEEFEVGTMPTIYTIGLTPSITQNMVVESDSIKSFVLPECQDSGRCLYGLTNILNSICASLKQKNMGSFFRREIETDGSSPISGRFLVRDSFRDNLWVVLTSSDEKDVESFELTDPSGRRYQFPKYEHGFSYFELEGPRTSGEWTYTFKLYETSKQKVFLDVSGEQSNKNSVNVAGWTVVDNKDSSKVYIYAQVLENSVPFKEDVHVVALVHRPSMEPVEVQLRDLGTGYPDLTANDGIYSAYFTKFSPEPGHYLVEIVVKSKNWKRFALAGSFYAEQDTGFYIREGSSVPINDVFPPSRITDFKVEEFLQDSLFVSVSWTCPGGDFDTGRASYYEIRCSTNRDSLRDDRYSQETILVDATLVPTPAEYGLRQDCTVGVPWHGQTFYYAIVALDEAGNRGEISNIVAVRIEKFQEPSVTLLPYVDETTSTVDVDVKITTEYDYSLIAYILCSLLMFFSISAFAIWRIVRHLKCHGSKCDSESVTYSDKGSNTLNNTTTEDIWSISDEKSSPTEATFHFETECRQPDLDLIKDIDVLSSLVLPPRNSVLEDMSVYRDLSNLDSQSIDYFELSRRLSLLLYGDVDLNRTESLV